MRARSVVLFATLSLSACMPLRQQKTLKGGSDSDFLLCEDRFLLAQFSPSNQSNTDKVISADSYILSPRGERYSVEVEPHQFDIEQKYPRIRERIYPFNTHGQRLRPWSTSIWTRPVA